MSAIDNIMNMTKFMVSLPVTHISVLSMVFLSFLTGIVAYIILPSSDLIILSVIIDGGTSGFLILGLMSIMAGAITTPMVNILDGRHMKMKQSMFLALVSMVIVSFIYLVGSLVSHLTLYNYTIDTLIYGCAVIFAFRTIIIWGTSNIRLASSVVVAAIQPALILSMLTVIVSLTGLTTNLGEFSIIAILLKIIIASIILVLAIFSFVLVIESPMRKNLGVGGLELLSLFIAHISEGSQALEMVFDDMGETIETLVGVLSFKGKNGIKALFLAPSVHPGPVGEIGGGNMPTLLGEKFGTFTMVSHGPSTHDFNPVASRELDKIERVVKESLDNMEYHDYASQFFRVENENAQIGGQFFGDDLVLLVTFSPHGFDDIDFGVGLAAMNAARSKGARNIIMVDCHNSFVPDSRILPGNKEVFQLLGAVEKIVKIDEQETIRIGCSYDPMEGFTKEQGVGQSGVKVMIIEVGGKQKTAYILLDANNMVLNYREKVIDAVLPLGIDEVEVMTTDTHYVNTLSGGHNPIGSKVPDEIIDEIKKATLKAMGDLEPVKVGVKVADIKDIKTFGPTHATELVTTISSIIAVSKVFAPLIFILAFVFAFLWIFYGV
jgi:putative membrane protein